QTSSRGASRTRVMTISRSEVSSTGLFLVSAMPLLLFFQLTQVIVQTIEPLLPYHTVMLQPIGYILEGASLQPARPPLRFAPPGDEPCVLQHFQVLGNRGHAHVEWLGQFGDRSLAGDQASQDRSPSGISKGGEGAAEVVGFHTVLHHQVK